MSSVPVCPPPLPPVASSFSGDRGEFRRLVLRGALLELITVGFYRFWLATDIRRHLWTHTAVDGDGFEYTGRGKELLMGFLFALAILMPIYLAYFLISVEAERFKAFASLPLVVGFYAFGQFAIYRARRYRLTRTVWRGLRFWMDGSGWAYALRSTLWSLLVVLTLGAAWPWREAALERYKMRHSRYGDLQGSFEGRGWELFKQVWGLWICAPFAIIIFPAAPFFYARFKAEEWRWWLSGIRLGGVKLESKLAEKALFGVYWKVIGWFILLGALLAAYFVLCGFLIGKMGAALGRPVAPEMISANVPFLIMTVIGYLALVLAFNAVMRVYLLRDVWVTVLRSVEILGIEAAADVMAKGELASALGEGFADGLDVAGF